MTVNAKTIAIALLLSSAIFFVWATLARNQTASFSQQLSASEAQESNEDNVTVVATPQQLTPGNQPVFQVSFDTHSVDLAFDVAAAASLTDGQGTSYGTPTWDGSPPGGHHRSGTLTFPTPLPVSAKQITLTLIDIADIPSRSFSWNIL